MRLTLRPALLTIAALLITTPVSTVEKSAKWWSDNLAGPDSSNYVDLDQIKKSNVDELEVAWTYPHAAGGFNPIVVDDVVYVYGRNGSLIALDASTGKEIWIHEGLNGITGRGINYWQNEDGKERRLLFSIDNFLQAVDARTGLSIPTFGMDGSVDLRADLLRGDKMGWNNNSPGKVWKNLLILGSTTGEAFISPPGDIRAYDVVTGKRVWQFHTVPPPGEFGYETWPKEAYKYVGGANTWGSFSIDDDRGIVFVPTGSATYDFYGADRLGQNLFANCLIALDAKTGKRLWHFQTVHHDLWDYDNVSAPQLVTVRHNGQRVDAVAFAGKTGFLYVFNRVTGAPLWPIEERPVPKSDVPGETAWPTQPFPTRPAPFARQAFTVDDVNPWLGTQQEYTAMKERVSRARNQGLFTPPAFVDTISMPGNQGGSNFGTTAANPQKGLVFVVNVNQLAILRLEDVKTRTVAEGRGGANSPEVGFAAYQQHCSSCHGANLRGVAPGAPSLVAVTDRMGEDAIKAIVTGGRGLMRPVPGITEVELTGVIAYLVNSNPNRPGGRGRGGPPPVFPPGPVVARGPAPHLPAPPRSLGPFYPGVGGNAGNYEYPEVAGSMPATRYMSDYGVLASWTKPPYTTITAYDLNTGEIMWQVPNGDHAPTMAAGGPANSGGLGARNGMVVTKGGLMFHAGGDGKFRAYDQDSGKVLWSAPFVGNAPGVPVSYESRGRQYVAVIASNGGGGPSGTDTQPASGVIAYALKRR
jgi:quinoprotein glucose dehydrogenase